jgi:glycosyltransferase involved in cell wall biosynthesis
MKKVIFIGSVATKKSHFDGERNKSFSICHCLKMISRLKIVNLSNYSTQFLVMIRFVFLILFWRPDIIFIGKSPHGCSVILKLIKFLKVPGDHVICYPYGRGLLGYDNLVDKKVFPFAGTIICENSALISDWQSCGCKRVLVFPCVREWYDIEQPKVFKEKEILSLIFWARVDKDKGVMDAISSVIRLNNQRRRFVLTIAGKPSSDAIDEEIKQIQKDNPESIVYLGSSFSSGNKDSFERLSTFDLNVFPTRYFHECVPGSVIDNLMAGVPTLSTKFFGYQDMIDETCAFFLENTDPSTIDETLDFIYKNQRSLFEKRALCKEKSSKYSEKVFISFLKENFNF